MKKISYILLFAAFSAQAQKLSTEITVERTVVPAERAATRLNSVSPSIVPATVQDTRIDMAEYGQPGTLTRSSYLLAPAAWADTFALSPYRGYVSAGYFPVYNLGVSAGYRLLQTSDTRLGVWGQFDGYAYDSKEHAENGKTPDFKNNSFAIGADFDRRFGRTGVLSAGVAYRFGKQSLPDSHYIVDRNLNMVDAKIAWWARAGRVGYHVGAELHSFGYKEDYGSSGYADGMPAPQLHLFDKGTETRFEANAGLITRLGGSSRAGLELKADFLSRPDGMVIVPDFDNKRWEIAGADGGTLGVMTATPYYAFGGDKGVNLRLGARLDISTGGKDKKFHVAPDVLASYAAKGFSIYARAGGGEVLNTQRSLYDYTPFFPAGWQYRRSHLPLTVDAGINVGPFAGFGIELFGGWARANNWLMPAFVAGLGGGYGDVTFLATDIKGTHAGVRASYSWRSMVDVKASVEFAPQKPGSGYYLWRDRAKMVLEASLAVRPVEKLEVNVGYELRADRAAYGYDGTEMPEAISLGDASLLSVSARYSITPALDVFTRGDNLLGSDYYMLPGVRAQGLHGLVGASFKF